MSASRAPSPTTSVTPATQAPSATSAGTFWAEICGTVSEFVKTTTTTDGSVVLSSPGRSPVKVTLTAARSNPEGSFGGYVCMAVDAGVPYPIFAGLGAPSAPDSYVAEGTYPATKAKPSPVGFVVPQACAFIRPPQVRGDQTTWWVDCGPELNRSARGSLGAALEQQGWTACGPAAASETFFKGAMRIYVSESSLAPGDYPVFSEWAGSGCG